MIMMTMCVTRCVCLYDHDLCVSNFQVVQTVLLGVGTLGTKILVGKLLGVRDDVCRHLRGHQLTNSLIIR